MKINKKIRLMLILTLLASILPVQYTKAGFYSNIFNFFKKKQLIKITRGPIKLLIASACLASAGLLLYWIRKKNRPSKPNKLNRNPKEPTLSSLSPQKTYSKHRNKILIKEMKEIRSMNTENDSFSFNIDYRKHDDYELRKIKSLIEDNLNPHIKIENGITLLHTDGANPHIKIEDDITLLHIACERGNFKLIKYLVEEKKIDIHAKDKKNNNALNFTMKTFHKNTKRRIFLYLAKKGVKILLNDYNVLHSACNSKYNHGEYKIAKYIIDNSDIDINQYSAEGYTALMYMYQKFEPNLENKIKLIKYLISKGANINLKEKYAYDKSNATCGTVLLSALSRDITDDVINLLLDHNVDLNYACYYGTIFKRKRTPFMALCLNPFILNFNLIKRFAEHGANINPTMKKGNEKRKIDIISLILKIKHISAKEIIEIINYLIKKGIDIAPSINNLKKHDPNFEVIIKKREALLELTKKITLSSKPKEIKELLKQLTQKLNNNEVPEYDKQTTALSIYKKMLTQNLNKALIKSKNIEDITKTIIFNNRFFEDEKFDKLRNFAIQNHLKDKFGRTILQASAIYTKDYNIINKAFIKNRRCYNQEDLQKTLKLVQKRNAKKLYRALDNSNSAWNILDKQIPHLKDTFSNIFEFAGLESFAQERIFFKEEAKPKKNIISQ